MSTKLRQQTIESLRKIINKDYGILINETDANNLAISLLRLSSLSVTALARKTQSGIHPSIQNINQQK